MTVHHDQNGGGGTVKLSARDWISLIVVIVSAAAGILMRMDFVENRMDQKFETMRSEWTNQAPSPAMWTKDNIVRINKELDELRARMTLIERHN